MADPGPGEPGRWAGGQCRGGDRQEQDRQESKGTNHATHVSLPHYRGVARRQGGRSLGNRSPLVIAFVRESRALPSPTGPGVC